MLLKKVTALVTAFAFTTSTYAMNMQELFDSVNAQGNVSNPAVLLRCLFGIVLCYALVTVGAVSANHTATRLDSISRRRDD